MFVVIWQRIITTITIEDLSAPLLTCSRRAPKGNDKVCHDVGRSIANLAWTIDSATLSTLLSFMRKRTILGNAEFLNPINPI